MSPGKKSAHRMNLADLSGHVETLESEFRKLARKATFPALVGALANTAGSLFARSSVSVAHKKNDSSPWEFMVPGDRDDDFSPMLPVPAAPVTSEICHLPGALLIVQRLADASLIAIVVSERRRQRAGSDLEVISLRLLASLFEGAHREMIGRAHEKGLVFSLKHRILQLNSLIDTGIEVASLRSNDTPHHLALIRAASLTNASRGIVRVERGKRVREQFLFPEGMTLWNMPMSKHCIRTQFTFARDTYHFELFDKESRSENLGFEPTDQLLLDALARQVQGSLENQHLHLQSLEKERIEHEISVASSIQKRIIPEKLPEIAGYDIAGTNIPSKSVGGDYYDCIPLRDGRFALVIADVAGKGVPAALLVSTLHAYLSAYLESITSMIELAAKLNIALYRASTDDKFVTALIAILSPNSGDIEYISAGHNPGYLLKRNGTVEELQTGGPPLGAFDLDMGYQSHLCIMEPDERLLLYTDGVTETINERDELYESKRSLTEFIAKHKPDRSDKFVAQLLADLRKFSGKSPQIDDITLLYLRRCVP